MQQMSMSLHWFTSYRLILLLYFMSPIYTVSSALPLFSVRVMNLLFIVYLESKRLVQVDFHTGKVIDFTHFETIAAVIKCLASIVLFKHQHSQDNNSSMWLIFFSTFSLNNHIYYFGSNFYWLYCNGSYYLKLSF